MPFGQHADLPSERVCQSTCLWAPPGGSSGKFCQQMFLKSPTPPKRVSNFISLIMFMVKGSSGPTVLSDDEDAGHTSGLHGVSR